MVLASFDLAPDQPCALQDHEVLGDRIQRDGEGAGDLIDGGRTLREPPQNSAPRRVCKRREDAIQFGGLRMFNQPVEYYGSARLLSKATL